MATAGHGRKGNEKVAVGTMFFVLLFVPACSDLAQAPEEHKCPTGDYANHEGVCCNKCSQGFRLVEMCRATGQRSKCMPCPAGQFMDGMNFHTNCRPCSSCKGFSKQEESPCQPHQNTICQCVPGYYKLFIDSVKFECRRCSKCGADEEEKRQCTQLNNTVCACKENFRRGDGNKCEPCKTCSSECEPLCPIHLPTNDPDTGKKFLINTIAGVAAAALVLLVAVVLITHVTTKRLTKRKLLKLSSQPCEAGTQDSSGILLSYDENEHNTTVEAVPQSPVTEQQLSNLPDCVPLEIKVADLIYTVLDLVPVLQVKQLVRSLGVKDTEIEQAETDHRSCREARYQMLRAWAERGSCAGGGGRAGGLLPRPLWQELLDKLRTMCLGGVAEELETKYGFQ